MKLFSTYLMIHHFISIHISSSDMWKRRTTSRNWTILV